MKTSQYLTETQMGEVAVNIISNLLIIHSDGRLSPFKPMADDGGIDLLIFDKESKKAIPCQVKSRTKTLNRYPNCVHFEVRKASYGQSTYLIAVYLDWDRHNIKKLWLIPPDKFPKGGKTKYVFRPSMSEETHDKFRQFRCDSHKEFTERIYRLF
jgi:hypothetical protein